MELTLSIIGTATPDAAREAEAERVGALTARAGAIVVCGGLGGVMAAACRGAHRAGGRTVGILPGAERAAANPWVDVVLPTGLGEARNLLVVRAGRAVIAIGGGYGTLSELAFARRLDIAIIGLRTWDLADEGIVRAADPDQAVRLALDAARAAPRRITMTRP